MAYKPVREVSAGDYWSALDVNRYIRDNFAAGVPDMMQAKGDMIVATGADAGARLAVGADGTILTADSGQTAGMKWAIDGAKDLVTTKGDLLGATGANALSRVAAGVNGSGLKAMSGQAAGLCFSIGAARASGSNGQYISSSVTYNLVNSESFDTESLQTANGSAFNYGVPTDKGGYYLIIGSMFYRHSDIPDNWEVNENAGLKITVGATVKGTICLHYAQAAAANDIFLSGQTIVYLSAGDLVTFIAFEGTSAYIGGTMIHFSFVRLG